MKETDEEGVKKEDFRVSLKEYFDVKLGSLDKATTLSKSEMDDRLKTMNEFRMQLKDQAANFFTRQEYELYRNQVASEVSLTREMASRDLKAFKDKIDLEISVLHDYKVVMEGKASQSSMVFVAIISVVGVLIGLAGILLRV